MRFFRRPTHTLPSTQRIELFSDAVIAIIATLLVLELKVPELHDLTLNGVFSALGALWPKFLAFGFSFLTVCVFWVNHHHFYHELVKSDWKLLWHNCHLLFWLSLIPFSTALFGEHVTVPATAVIYCFNMCMGTMAFMLMSHHALFDANLTDHHVTMEQKEENYHRGWIGVWVYALSGVVAPFFLPLTIAGILFVPLFYVVPSLMHDHEAMDKS